MEGSFCAYSSERGGVIRLARGRAAEAGKDLVESIGEDESEK